MINQWTNWKPFPRASGGGHLEAPVGPGVYEVYHTVVGEQVAFGCSGNVAQALLNVARSSGKRSWPFFRKAARVRYQSHELEYRTCATLSLAEARIVMQQMVGHRQAMWRRFAPSLR